MDLIMYGEARLRDAQASSLQRARASATEIELSVHRLIACYPDPSSGESATLKGLAEGIAALRKQLENRHYADAATFSTRAD